MQNDKEIRFYYPSHKFPSVSVTGASCDLMCNHCKGYYLKNMYDVNTPKKLRDFCIKHESNGGVGLLISGGSTKEGKVPMEPFLPTLRWVKDNTGLILNLHTGMLNKREAENIASTGIDVVSIDLVGSEETLTQVYRLNTSVEEYMGTLIH
ncbi:MAG: radical SAM protein, partial [Candidatus Thorarchaeota archaeon]